MPPILTVLMICAKGAMLPFTALYACGGWFLLAPALLASGGALFRLGTSASECASARRGWRRVLINLLPLLLVLPPALLGRAIYRDEVAWCQRHGDERLRLITQNGYLLRDGNESLYFQQRFVPNDWFTLPGITIDDPTLPNLDELHALPTARSLEADAELGRVTWEDPAGGDHKWLTSVHLGNHPTHALPSPLGRVVYDPERKLRSTMAESRLGRFLNKDDLIIGEFQPNRISIPAYGDF